MRKAVVLMAILSQSLGMIHADNYAETRGIGQRCPEFESPMDHQ